MENKLKRKTIFHSLKAKMLLTLVEVQINLKMFHLILYLIDIISMDYRIKCSIQVI